MAPPSPRSWSLNQWLPILPAAAVLIGSALLWMALRQQQTLQLELVAGDATNNIENEIRARLDVRLRALERAARRWEAQGPPSRAAWEADALLIVEHGLVNRGLAWADTDFVVRWVAPRAGNEIMSGYDLKREPSARDDAMRARDDTITTVTHAAGVIAGDAGILTLSPIHRAGAFEGLIVGVFDVETLLADILANTAPGFGVLVRHDSIRVYSRPPAQPADPRWVRTRQITLPGGTWSVDVWPGTAIVTRIQSALPNTVLLSGALVSVLVGAVLYLRRTAVRQAHEARLSRARYLDLYDNAPDMFLSVDLTTGRFIECNEAVMRQLGYTRDEVIGQPQSGFYTGEALPRVPGFFEEFKRTGELRNVELQVVHRDGYPIDISMSATAIRDGEGRVIQSRGIWRDITNLKRTQEALRRSEERLNHALGAAHVGTWDWDIAADRFSWDDYVRALYGLPHGGQPANQESHRRLVHPDDRDHQETAVRAALERNVAYECEYRVLWPDDSVHYISARGKVIREASGRAVRMVGVAWDITSRKRAEEAQAAYAAELARSNQELEMFAYVASHDLHEPLRMVASYTQLLARRYNDQLDDAAREFIAYAVDGARRMQQLINDLLSYSRVQRKGAPLAPIDANEALADALADLKLAIDEAGAVVTVDRLPRVLADRSQLTQLFRNLLGNALKFHGPHPPEIRVSARAERGEWVFAVRDNGIGIDQQFAGRIFEIFQRLHTRSEYVGTGIGLALCKKIVERHGGSIWQESQPNQGATFYFTLARAENNET